MMCNIASLLLAAMLATSPFYTTPLPPEAEILIVADADNAQEAQSLLRVFTYLKRTAAVATPDAASLVLTRYEAVVCLDPVEASSVFVERLAVSDKPLFLIGSRFSRIYLEYTGNLGSTLTGAASWQYEKRGFETKSGVAALANAPLLAATEYHAGNLLAGEHTVPLFSGIGRLRLLPVPLTPSLLPALTRELLLWLWPYADDPPDHGTYLVLDHIYPFTERRKLLSIIDRCIDAGIPFVLAVQPIYRNGDYPAMRRFCELLAYAQANGGAVLLRAPLWQGEVPPLPALQDAFTKALTLYTANGVYPLGAAVPSYWQENTRLREALARFRTVLLLEDTAEAPFAAENRNVILDDGHQLLVQLPEADEAFSSYSSAVCLDVNTLLEDDLEKAIQVLKFSGVPPGSLWSMEHAVYANNLTLLYDGTSLTLNGERKQLAYTPATIDAPYNYGRGMLSRVTMNLAGGSKLALVVTIFTLALFLVLMLIGRRQGKQSFFHRKDSDDDTP